MKPDISVVIPVYNEQQSLQELYKAVRASLEHLKKTYEIIFIDDGSTDETLKMLQTFERENEQVKVYSLRKNLGKSYALMLGFHKASGNYVVTLDADLQDDPKHIETLLTKAKKEQLDLVNGWRKERKDSVAKVLSSKLFNLLISFFFDLHIHDVNSGLKIYTSEVAKSLKLYGGLYRFIPLLVYEMGYTVAEVPVSHRPRKFGASKYKINKVFTDIPDLFTIYFLTKYTRRPLHFFGKVGSVLFFLGFTTLLYLSILRFMGESIGRRPLLIFGVLLVISGIQIVVTGFLADLIVNVRTNGEDKFPLRYESSK